MAALALALLTVLGWTALTATTAKAEDQDVMVLSSWTPVLDGGAVTGGSQTITITNVGSETLGTFALDTRMRPCDCAVTGRTITSGTVLRGVWAVTNLAAGETAEMSARYGVLQGGWLSLPSDTPNTAALLPL